MIGTRNPFCKLMGKAYLPPFSTSIFVLGYRNIQVVITPSTSTTSISQCGKLRPYTHLWPLLKLKWPWSIRIKVTFSGHPSLVPPQKMIPGQPKAIIDHCCLVFAGKTSHYCTRNKLIKEYKTELLRESRTEVRPMSSRSTIYSDDEQQAHT